MKYFVYLIFFTLVIGVGCKEPGQNGTTSSKVDTSTMPIDQLSIIHNQRNISDSMVVVWRNHAKGILEHRISQSDPKMTTSITKDLYHVQGVLRGSDVTFGHDLKGAWFDFNDDQSYTYGYFAETYGSGRYHYETNRGLLLLVDNDERMKPQEFKVIAAAENLVLQGEATYNDNNMQVKMNRQVGFPQPPPPARDDEYDDLFK